MSDQPGQSLATADPYGAPAERESVKFSTIGFGDTGFNLSPQDFGQVVAFAKVMCTAGHAIPAHLRNNPGACMAVTLDSIALRCHPFMLARKSYMVKDILAYEAQVFVMAANTAPITLRRPTISYTGEGPTRQCTVVLHLRDGDCDPVTSPAIKDILVQNSPLWKSDPDQQLAYYTQRSAIRRHCPEVMMMMMDRDEAEAASPMDVVEGKATSGLAGRLAAAEKPLDPKGFDVRGIDANVEGEKPKPPKKAKAPTPATQGAGDDEAIKAGAQAEPGEAGQAVAEAMRDAGGSQAGESSGTQETAAQDKPAAELAAEDDRPTSAGATTATEPVQTAGSEPDSSASATLASGGSPAAISSPPAPAEPTTPGPGALPVTDRVDAKIAALDSSFFHYVGDKPNAAGQRPFYDERGVRRGFGTEEDGVAVRRMLGIEGRRCTWAGEDMLEPDESDPREAQEADPAETAPGQPTEAAAGPAPHPSEPEAEISGQVEDQVNGDVPDGFDEFFDSISEAANWGECKMAIRALYAREDFKALDEFGQHQIRRATCNMLEERGITVDYAQEPAAFRIWIETRDGPNGADDIEGVWRVLEKEPAFEAMPDANKASLRLIVTARLEDLRSGG